MKKIQKSNKDTNVWSKSKNKDKNFNKFKIVIIKKIQSRKKMQSWK